MRAPPAPTASRPTGLPLRDHRLRCAAGSGPGREPRAWTTAPSSLLLLGRELGAGPDHPADLLVAVRAALRDVLEALVDLREHALAVRDPVVLLRRHDHRSGLAVERDDQRPAVLQAAHHIREVRLELGDRDDVLGDLERARGCRVGNPGGLGGSTSSGPGGPGPEAQFCHVLLWTFYSPNASRLPGQACSARSRSPTGTRRRSAIRRRSTSS